MDRSGHLLRPQGRRGEVLADLLTDFPERFQDHPEIYLAAPGFAGPPGDALASKVSSSWQPVGRNEGRIVLGFDGIESINAAEPLCGRNVIIPTQDRPALDEDASYVDDLIGCTVFDGEVPIGTLAAVEFATTPDGTRKLQDVAPLLTVTTETGDEVLIPFAQAFLISQDLERKQIHMQLPAGLLDLNRSTP